MEEHSKVEDLNKELHSKEPSNKPKAIRMSVAQKKPIYKFIEVIEDQHQKNSKPIAMNVNNWAKLRLDSIIVDKTLLIYSIVKSHHHRVITRPKRWGKSFNLSMLTTFFNCPLTRQGKINYIKLHLNRALFIGSQKNKKYQQKAISCLEQSQKPQFQDKLKPYQNLEPMKIQQYWSDVQRHFAHSIVLSLNFIPKQTLSQQFATRFTSRSFQLLLYKVIDGLYRKHKYLRSYQKDFDYFRQKAEKRDSEAFSPLQFLQALLIMLYQYHQMKIIILIDQYDAPVNQALKNKDSKEQFEKNSFDISESITTFLRYIVKTCHEYVSKVICTGIRMIINQNEWTSPGMEKYTIFAPNDTGQFYGFTEKEIYDQLILKKFKSQSPEHKDSINQLMNVITEQYNGYKLLLQNEKDYISVYNPYSVAAYLDKCANTKEIQHMSRQSRDCMFWIKLAPEESLLKTYIDQIADNGNTLFLAYLFRNLLDNYHINEVKNKQLTQLQDQIIHFSAKTTGDERITRTDKQLTELKIQQAIYMFVECGYLTYENKTIKIPNNEIRFYLEGIMFKYIKSKLQEGIAKDQGQNIYQQKQSIQQWSQYYLSKISQRLNRFLNMFGNFCEALFSALLLINFMIFKDNFDYQIEFQKRLSNIQPDMIFIPESNQKPAIIHQHKVCFSSSNTMKCQQKALFQIFNKNYFKAALNSDNKQKSEQMIERKSQWTSLIMRSVVGCYSMRQLRIFSNQILLQRKIVERLSQFQVLVQKYVNHDKRNGIEDFIMPYGFDNEKITSTQNFIMQFQQNFQDQVYIDNMRLIKNVLMLYQEQQRQSINNEFLREQGQQRQSGRLRHPRHPHSFGYEIEYITNFLKLKFFGFTRIETNFNSENPLVRLLEGILRQDSTIYMINPGQFKKKFFDILKRANK